MPEGGGSRWRARVGQGTRRPEAASPRAAVLARGDDPPEPPEAAGQGTRRPEAASPRAAVLARGDDPPEPPEAAGQGTRRPEAASPRAAVLARGDDPPEPPEAAGPVSCTFTCTPSTPCWTAPPGSGIGSPPAR